MPAIFFKSVKCHSPLLKSASVADKNMWDFRGDSFLFFMGLYFTLGKNILKWLVMVMLDTDQRAVWLRSNGNKKQCSVKDRRNTTITDSFINPLSTKRRLLYLKTQFVPRSKHFSSRL